MSEHTQEHIEREASRLVNTSIDAARSSLGLWKPGDRTDDMAILKRAAELEIAKGKTQCRGTILAHIRSTVRRLRGDEPGPDLPAAPQRGAGRPPRAAGLLPERTLDQRVAAIHAWHHEAITHAAKAAQAACMAGLELQALRYDVPEGQFEQFVEDHVDFGISTAKKYMALADRLRGKLAEELVGDTRLLNAAPSELSVEERDTLVERVRRIADGHTLQQLYFDFGILKPHHNPGGDHGGGKAMAEQIREFNALPLEEQRRRKDADAWQEWNLIEKALDAWFAKHRYDDLSSLHLDHVRDILKQAQLMLPKS